MLRRVRVLRERTLSSELSPPLPINPTALRPTPTPIVRETREDKLYSEYKKPYVLAPFIKDAHLAAMQHVEFGGMYREELAIERTSHVRTKKVLTINTDGSLSERETELTAPALVVLFTDRQAVHRERMRTIVAAGMVEDYKQAQATWRAADDDAPAPTPAERPLCNAVAFPYCVPSMLAKRKQRFDLLDPRHSVKRGDQ